MPGSKPGISISVVDGVLCRWSGRVTSPVSCERMAEINIYSTVLAVVMLLSVGATAAFADDRVEGGTVYYAVGDNLGEFFTPYKQGGLSGKPLKQRSTEVIEFLYRRTEGRLPIIGVGGIFTTEDAWEKITRGASLLQIFTGFVYEGPLAARQINQGLERLMKTHGFQRLQDAVGSAVDLKK